VKSGRSKAQNDSQTRGKRGAASAGASKSSVRKQSLDKQTSPRKTGAAARSAAANKPSDKTAKSRGAGKPAAGTKRQSGAPQKNADNAALIQDVALDLFAQTSFSAVTIKDIGKATGLNTAMIYYYFPDKEGLFRETVEIAVKRSLAAFEAHGADDPNPPTVISNWLETHVEQLDLIRKFIKISLDYANSGKRVARIDRAIQNFYAYEREVLGSAIKKGIANKQFAQRDPAPVIDFISTYLDGVMIRSFIVPDFDAVNAIRRFKMFILGQLKRKPPSYLSK
jgi:AcrR family transcriptional regulator